MTQQTQQKGATHQVNATLRGVTHHDIRHFENARFEPQRIAIEAVGTFILVLVACGAGMLGTMNPGTIPQYVAALAVGFILPPLILGLGKVSGAHFNTAVTVAYALRGTFPWWRVPGYVIGQLVGAVLAAGFLRLSLGDIDNVGSLTPDSSLSWWGVFMWEGLLTFGFIFLVLACVVGAMNVGPLAAFAISGYFLAMIAIFGSLTGPSMNPARQLGPAIVSGNYVDIGAYILGPLVGAALAVAFGMLFRSAAAAAK